MKTKKIYALVFILSICQFHAAIGQESTGSRMQSLDFMKVEPENHAEYLMLEKAWKKIHQYNKDQGKISGWELTQVISPTGSQTEYNYVTRISLKEGKQFEEFMQSFPMPDDLSSILSPEEIKLVNRTNDLRTYIKNEIFTVIESIFDEESDQANIQVFNYFDHPKGKKRADHVENEVDVWMPVHRLRIADDKMEGWVLAGKTFPFGSNQEYHEITVDVYKDMSQLMSTSDYPAYFSQAHPGKDVDDLMEKTSESGIIIKGEVRKLIDYLE